MTAGMLSIPRDLWVSIPGFDYGKINTAYQLGEAFKLPGGGPGLAIDTVERLIGVPVQYYAQIDFSVFVSFIQEIHGIKIDVPYEIYIDICFIRLVSYLSIGYTPPVFRPVFSINIST